MAIDYIKNIGVIAKKYGIYKYLDLRKLIKKLFHKIIKNRGKNVK